MRTRPATPLTTDEILVKMESFCAYRERCPQEVRTRMAELGAKGEAAEQIFECLREDGFFNEQRFALAYAGGKFRINQWGRVRIRIELQRRNIAPELVREAIDSIEESEYLDLLHTLLEKKRALYARESNPREKIAAALIRAGFEQALVFRYL